MTALRSLRNSPASNALIVFLLALGLSAGATILTLFDAIVLRPLSVPHPEQLVRMVQQLPKLPPRSDFPYLYYQALHDHAGTLQSVFAETEDGAHFRLTEPGAPQMVTVSGVTPDFFKGLGVRPYIGRLPAAEDSGEAVVSFGFWRNHLAADKNIAGKTVTVNEHRLPVAGVMPRDFNGLSLETSPDIRVSMRTYSLLTGMKMERADFQIAGRLQAGVTMIRAEAECLAIWQAAMPAYYASQKETADKTATLLKRGMRLESMARGTSFLRTQLSDVLKLMLAAVTVLMLIVALNVAGLLLARVAARQREIALKLAIGASPMRLAADMALESGVLSAIAFGLAVCFAAVMTPLALRMLPPVRDLYTSVIPVSLNASLNWRVIFFLLTAAAATMLIFSVSPVMLILRMRIDSVLRTVRSGGGLRGRQILIAVQMALSTFLLITAGLLAHSFRVLSNTPSGVSSEWIATFTCDLTGYKNAPAMPRDLMESIRQIPGVVSAAASSLGIMRGHGRNASAAPAGQRIGHAEFMASSANDVSPGYFQTMGMRLLAGRDFIPSDAPGKGNTAPKKVVVNEAFAQRFFAEMNPLGKRFGTALEGAAAGADYEIVGVVSNAKYRSLREPIRPMFYTMETDFDSFVLNVRTSLPPENIFEPVRKAAASVAPGLPFLEVNTLAREVEETTAPERTVAGLASLFGFVAAIIVGVGTYGLLAYSVIQRRREIGIRMALGSRPFDVVSLVARQTIVLGVIGIAAGITAAVVAGPAIRALLFGLSPFDPAAFALAGLLVAAMAAMASIAPILNATRVQPAETLRAEN